MRVAIAVAVGLLVGACEAPGMAEKFASTPVSVQVCSFYIRAATEAAQSHCSASGANAELVGTLGKCEFPGGAGSQYSFMTSTYPVLYNFRCVR